MLDIVRRMLVEPPFTLSIDEAKTFTLYSYRHVYNTAMRQPRFTCDDIEDAGHWKRGRANCRTYDSADCIVELASKEHVRSAMQGGWRCVSSACLPTPAPQPSLPGSKRTLSTPSVKRPLASPRKVLPIYVIHISKHMLHIWACTTKRGRPARRTKCRTWSCGGPMSSSKLAHFLSDSHLLNTKHFDCCGTCIVIYSVGGELQHLDPGRSINSGTRHLKIEAMGPPVILSTWPGSLAGCSRALTWERLT